MISFYKKSVIFLLFFQVMVHTTNAQNSSNNYFYRFYFTAGIYLGYSTGAALGFGPKFTLGFLSYDYNRNTHPDAVYVIANNITTGYIRHLGTVRPSRELLFELQTVNMRFSDFLIPDYCIGAGGGISLFWYQKNEVIRDFYARPRVSAFAGNLFFMNASKTFGLPNENGYTGLHFGGTAVLGFPFWVFAWD